MPYTDEEKRNILVNAGLDPSQYTYNENTGNAESIVQGQPAPQAPAQDGEDNLSAPRVSSQANQFTPLQTGWMHAKASIAPTLGGFGGALAGSKVPGPWPVKLAGGVAGGLFGSMGTGKLQEQVITPQFQQDLAASQQQNPKSSFLGDLIPSLLGMSPGKSIAEIPTLLSALRKSPQVARSGLSALEAAEQNVLMNVGMNAGVGAGVNIAEQNNSQNKEPFSYGQLAAHALIPALTLSEPNSLGKYAGFHGSSDIRAQLAERNLATDKQTEAARQQIAQQEDNAVVPSKTLPSQEPTPAELRRGTSLPDVELGDRQRKGQFVRSREPVDINTFEGEGGAIDKTEVQHELTAEKAKQDLIEQQKVKAELDRQEAEKLAQENKIRSDELRRIEEAKKPKVETELTPEEQVAATDYDKQYSEKPVTEETTPEQKLQLDLEQRRLAGVRGIKIEDKSVIHHETGVPQAGVNIQEARLARKSLELGGESTINHEAGGHGYPNDLLASSDPADQALAKKGLDIFKISADPKEELAKYFEAGLYERQKDKLFGNKATKFKNYMSDVKAHVKSKFGLASDKEVLQHLMSRYEGDAPFGTRFEVGNPRVEPKAAGAQQYSAPPTQTDNPDWHKQVDEMHNATAPRIMELSKEKSLTQRSIDTGLGVTKLEDVQKLERNRALAEEKFNKTMDEYKAGDKEKINELSPLAQKVQYFSEAIQAAKGEGGIGEHLKKTKEGYEPPASRMYSEKALGKEELNSKAPILNEATKQEAGPIKDEVKTEAKPTETKQYSSKPIEPGVSIPVMRSEVEKIARLDKGSVNGPVIARGASNFYEGLSRFKGKLVNTPIRNIRDVSEVNSGVKSYLTQDNPDLQAVRDYVDDKAYGVAPKTLTPKQQAILDILRKDNIDVRDMQKTYPGLRQPKGSNEDYNRPVPARSVLDTVMNKPSSPEGIKLIKEFIDYQKASNPKVHTDAEAIAELETLKAGFDKASIDIAKQFGPIDKAEGVGIPRSWLEPNFLERMSRYGERVARRFAYHESIESQPEVMDALNKGTSGLRAADPVRVVFNNISGIRPKSERILDSLGGVTRAFMLGPLTGLKDITAGQFLGWQHQTPIQAAQLALKRYENFRANRLESFDQGVNREAIGSLEGSDDISAIVRRIRDLGFTFSGRGIMEQVSRTVAYTEGKWLTMDNFANFHKGDTSAQGKKFLNDFGPDDWQTRKTPLTPQEIKDAASRYVESVQGSYDFRGLPAFSQEGSLSPVLALARWNIEKTNNFMKHVITPAVKEGNFTPLLMSTVGALIGGAAVQQLTEVINGRKQKTPEWDELKAASDAGASGVASGAAYKLAAYASLSGYAGIITDLAKGYGDIAFKNKPQTYHNVLVDAVANIGSTLMDAAQAIQDGAGIEVLADAVGKVLEDNIQAYRIVANHPELYAGVAPDKAKTKSEDMARQDKLRDLRTFKGLYDYPIGDASSAPNINAFENQDIKRFKHTSDPAEAIALYPKLIQKAIADAKGDPEKLKSALQSLKANSYQTMPKPETNPLEFTRYMSYLRASQGDSVALSRLADWAQQNSLNKAKTGMIP